MIRREQTLIPPFDGDTQKQVRLERQVATLFQQAAQYRVVAYTGDGVTARVVELGIPAQVVLILKSRANPGLALPTGGAALAFRDGQGVTYVFGTGYANDAITAFGTTTILLGTNTAVNAASQSYLAFGVA